MTKHKQSVFDAHCCHMGTAATAIKHPVPDWVKPSFVIFDIRALWRSECPDVKNYKWRLNPVWHRMVYSCTHMATVCVKGLTPLTTRYTPTCSKLLYGARNSCRSDWVSV